MAEIMMVRRKWQEFEIYGIRRLYSLAVADKKILCGAFFRGMATDSDAEVLTEFIIGDGNNIP